jgi:hypothetical protein
MLCFERWCLHDTIPIRSNEIIGILKMEIRVGLFQTLAGIEGKNLELYQVDLPITRVQVFGGYLQVEPW